MFTQGQLDYKNFFGRMGGIVRIMLSKVGAQIELWLELLVLLRIKVSCA